MLKNWDVRRPFLGCKYVHLDVIWDTAFCELFLLIFYFLLFLLFRCLISEVLLRIFMFLFVYIFPDFWPYKFWQIKLATHAASIWYNAVLPYSRLGLLVKEISIRRLSICVCNILLINYSLQHSPLLLTCRIETVDDAGKQKNGCTEVVNGRVVSSDAGVGFHERCKRFKSW